MRYERRTGARTAGCVALAVLLLAGALLAGCSDNSQTKLTEKEKANFAGGPMPADYKDPTLGKSVPPAVKPGTNPAANPPGPASQNK
jgi:hypothetical protein